MTREIKLSITGAGGVGKSTLARELAKQRELPLIPELARILCEQAGHKRIGEIPDQEAFKKLVLKKQIEEEAKFQSFIADRGVIDCWVLWQRWNICSAMTFDTEEVYERVRAHSKSYTHIVYLEPGFSPEEDGFRWTEPDYIKQIDRIIRMTFYDLQIWDRVLSIKSDNFQTRLEELNNWLDRH
ncbi:MAG: ATP-binding protein [Candidatus Obscuribacterales bacterium]|nr:ATP-binding protein [Candidatus Obscuribacterales bacterium]